MSRVEKYRTYRERIKNKNDITNVINTSSAKVNEFRKIINDLNSKILLSYKPISIDLFEFLSSDISARDNTYVIQNLLEGLNFNELMVMREQANLLFLSIKHKKTDLEFEEGWLNNNQGIQKIGWCNKVFNEIQKENINFDKVSITSFSNFLSVIQTAETALENLKLKKVTPIPLIKNYKFKYFTFIFFIALFGVSTLLCFIAFIVSVLI